MNQFKNEMTIEIGGEKILLAASFENIAKLESNLASISYLAWKFSRGSRASDGSGKDSQSTNPRETIGALPSITEITQIIFYCQKDSKFSLEEIFGLISSSGSFADVMVKTTIFIGRILAGPSKFDEEDLEQKKKKSHPKGS